MDVPVRAGDVLIGDARLLHASHANRSDSRRTVITLWYYPDLSSLSEPLQAFAAKLASDVPQAWPEQAQKLVEKVWVRYDGAAEPLPFNRQRPLNGTGA